jgi:hypothetical protein
VASLQDLLVPRDRETIEALLLSTLQGEGFPVTDWEVGGVARTILKMIATGLLDRETLIGYISAGGYLDFAAELTDPNGTPVEGWLELLAEQQYDIIRAGATFTQKRLTLTCTSGPGPYTRSAGQLIAISQAGNTYRNVASVTIPDGGSVEATFQAETPGAAVVDATGTIDELTTPLPGVTVLDQQASFSTPVSFQVGSGTITPSAATMPATARTLKVAITVSGLLSDTTAYYTVTKYSGGVVATYGPYQMTSATYVDSDVTLTFADGAAGTSFVAGDMWYVSTPGEATIQNGADQETAPALAQRCRDRWPSLSIIPTEGKYAAWVRECSIEQSLGINRITTSPSTTIAGMLNVYVADQTGTAPPEVVTALQAYVDLRTVDIEYGEVQTAVGKAVTVTGVVQVKRGRLLAVKALAKSEWNAYLATVPIGGENPGGVVRFGKLWQILMEAGAFDASSLLLNSAATDLSLYAYEVPTVGSSGTDNLTWVEVA